MKKLLAGVIALCGVSSALAGPVAYDVKITRMDSYPEYGNGDVIVQYSGTSVAGCSTGFWLSPSQPGFKQTYAMLLAAASAGRTVTLYSDSGQLWSGSGDQWCKLSTVRVSW